MTLVRLGVVAVVVLTLAITAIVYPALPDQVPSHWNAAGEVDGYLPRLWGAAIVPLIMIPLTALFFLIPRIDPLRENYRKFQPYYEGFILVFALFFAIIQVQILLWGIGIEISPNIVIPPLFGALFIYIGFLLDHAEPNWFVGIRTPWTMSSEKVWKKTHAMGGRLFKIAGIVSIVGVFFGSFALWFCLVPVLLVAGYTVVYSYIQFQRERISTG
ncbi:MAG TPA: SdpI family protein [Methanolinea sp.]|nr:SdpI family protein [Methanolinea sp.]